MLSDSLDLLSLKILHALQIDGRASFSRIGDILGVSDQTVARRYARLRATGAVRVVGLTDSETVGEEEWLLRIQCAPEAAAGVAAAVSRHPETRWVQLTSGATEIVCTTRSAAGGDSALLRDLPRARRVTGVSAHWLLHTFYGGGVTILNKVGPLTGEQVRALRPPPPELAGTVALSSGDRALVAELTRDGRTTYRDLARTVGLPQSAVQRRLAELRRSGALYFRVDFDDALIGRGTVAILWLSVSPSALVEVGTALAAHDEVTFVGSTTGPTNLYAVVLTTSPRALHDYLTGPVAALPAIGRLETAPLVRPVKRAGVPVTG
ncbi:Lrp/AsnC family transcriptional regulator [Amycolatopsis halotolerans]|uniref:Lrp/AsnC family transcriptional regulator n=1 Tax=Amycolatopsis halotolerans TaxID=330083 RepID=A0ABV7QAW3_9PSEU